MGFILWHFTTLVNACYKFFDIWTGRLSNPGWKWK